MVALNIKTRAKARSEACIHNLKQIGIALLLYENDHKETLPTDFKQLEIYLYGTNPNILLCPSDQDRIKIRSQVLTQSEDNFIFHLDTNILSYEMVSPSLRNSSNFGIFVKCPFHGHVVYTDGTLHLANGGNP
jgi:hypothetical protein